MENDTVRVCVRSSCCGFEMTDAEVAKGVCPWCEKKCTVEVDDCDAV